MAGHLIGERAEYNKELMFLWKASRAGCLVFHVLYALFLKRKGVHHINM